MAEKFNIKNQGYFVQGYHANTPSTFEEGSPEARQWNDGAALRQRHDAMGMEQLPSGLAPTLDSHGTPMMFARLEESEPTQYQTTQPLQQPAPQQ